MKDNFKKTWKMYADAMPIMIAILLLINLINPVLQKYYTKIFIGDYLLDSIIGSAVGSISFGIPITSYIIGGELFKKGISLLAITAFIMSWSTVGIAMFPLEAMYMGKKFALVRNLINFIFSIVIAILAVYVIFTIKKWF